MPRCSECKTEYGENNMGKKTSEGSRVNTIQVEETKAI